MADITREIEITAALSADYQAAFNAASGIARDTSKELSGLVKREADLARMTEIAGQSAAASAANDAKSVEKLQKEYDRLAEKMGLADKSAEAVAAELRRVGERRRDVEALNKSASRSAEMGRLARDIERYTSAAKKIKDPALLAALDRAKKRYKELGGSFPDSKRPAGFFATLKAGLAQSSGPLAGAVRQVQSLGAAFRTTGGGIAIAAAGITAAVGGIVSVLTSMVSAAVSAVKALWDLGVDTIKTGDQIAKTSRQLGIDAEAYQEFAYAVGLGGASERDFDTALRQLNKQMEAAIAGNSKAVQSFRSLGISMQEVRSLNTEEMFVRMSDALAEVDDTASKTRTVMALFGEQGHKVATAIAGGSKELQKMRDEAKKAGYVLNGSSLKKAEEANDNFTRAQLELKGVIREIGIEIMPTVNEVLKDFVQLIRDNKDNIKEFARVIGKGFAEGARAAMNIAHAISDAIPKIKSFIFDWFNLPSTITKTFRGLSQSYNSWASDVGARIRGWFTGLVQNIKDKLSRFFSWILDNPLVNKLLGDDGKTDVSGIASAVSQGVTLVVNNSIDARGAAPGAEAGVSRALDVAAPASAERAALVLEEYNNLSYARR